MKIKDALTFDEIAEIVDSYNADNNKSKTAVSPDEQLNNQMKIEYWQMHKGKRDKAMPWLKSVERDS